MSASEATILALRIAVLAGLYLFLLAGFVIAWRELRASVQRIGAEARPTAYEALADLVVIESEDTPLTPGDRFPLRPVTSLGRDLSNTIVLPDPAVSAEHALLALRDGHWWLEDLGSTNGTYLNDVRLTQPTLVVPGDVIRIGHTRFRLARR